MKRLSGGIFDVVVFLAAPTSSRTYRSLVVGWLVGRLVGRLESFVKK